MCRTVLTRWVEADRPPQTERQRRFHRHPDLFPAREGRSRRSCRSARSGADQSTCAAARKRANGSADSCAAADQRDVPLLMIAAYPLGIGGVDPNLLPAVVEGIESQPEYGAALEPSGMFRLDQMPGAAGAFRKWAERFHERSRKPVACAIAPGIQRFIQTDMELSTGFDFDWRRRGCLLRRRGSRGGR